MQCYNSRGGLTARDEFLPTNNDVNSPMAAHLNTLLIQHFLISIVRNSILSWINTKYTRIINNIVPLLSILFLEEYSPDPDPGLMTVAG